MICYLIEHYFECRLVVSFDIVVVGYIEVAVVVVAVVVVDYYGVVGNLVAVVVVDKPDGMVVGMGVSVDIVVVVVVAVDAVAVVVAVVRLGANWGAEKKVLFDLFPLKIVQLLSHAMLGTAQNLIQQLQQEEDLHFLPLRRRPLLVHLILSI